MSSESHKKEYTGSWIPRVVMDLFEEGTINPRETLLLTLIDSFSKTDLGCVASNEYLGKKMHVGADQVGRMTSHLRKLGLVEQVSFDGRRREMRTCWDQALEKVRKPRSECEAEADSDEKPELNRENVRGRPGRKADHISKEDKQRGISKENSLSPPPVDDGKTEDSKPSKTKVTSFDRKAAQHLEQTVSSHVKVNAKADMKSWANDLRLMRTKDKIPKKEIREKLQWYRENIGDQFVPEALSAGSFRRKWNQIVMAAKRTSNGENRFKEKEKLISRVRAELGRRGQYDINQRIWPPDLKQVLTDLDLPLNSVKISEV